MSKINKVILLAQEQIGYLEKESNNLLDDDTSNVGDENFTKYARDLDAIPDFYNGDKNGYSWCAVFVNWLFVKSFGVDATRAMCYLPRKSGSASCSVAIGYYKKNGQFYSDPKVGDQIFFYNSKGKVAHTGIVEMVANSTVYTIEGNTSVKSGVVENGGGVFRKSYNVENKRIAGYGRPNYGHEVDDEEISGPKTVADIQKWLNDDFGAGLIADGEYGSLTKRELVKAAQKIIGVNVDGIFGPNSKKAWKLVRRGNKSDQAKVVQAMLICLGYPCGPDGADGYFGTNSVTALKKFQKDRKMVVDGMAGVAVATKMFA